MGEPLKSLAELQRTLERYETINDGLILPDMHLVIRLDAHRFGNWSAIPAGEYPTGPAVSQALIMTALRLMAIGFQTKMAYVHGDEIAVYLDPNESTNPRRRARLVSLFASAASSEFLQQLGLEAHFHAKLSELPNETRLLEYFLWQRRCAMRNLIVSQIRSAMIAKGKTPQECEKFLAGVKEDTRLETLEDLGIKLSGLSAHARYGTLIGWDKAEGRLQGKIFSHLSESDETFMKLLRTVTQGLSSASDYIPDEIPAIISSTDNISPPAKVGSHFEQRRGFTRKQNTSVFKIKKNS